MIPCEQKGGRCEEPAVFYYHGLFFDGPVCVGCAAKAMDRAWPGTFIEPLPTLAQEAARP